LLANYGFKDGSGEFFITIDTGKCAKCMKKPCLKACPGKIFEKFIDDYDDEVVGVTESFRNRIKEICASCKPVTGKSYPACQKACPYDAIQHSW